MPAPKGTAKLVGEVVSGVYRFTMNDEPIVAESAVQSTVPKPWEPDQDRREDGDPSSTGERCGTTQESE